MEIQRYLDDLESRIDPAAEEDYRRQWADFYEGRCAEDVFIPVRKIKNPAAVEWPAVTVNEALADFRAMALQQYGIVSQRICDPEMSPAIGVRCNYGSSILPSLFGAEMFYMDDKSNTLPTSRPLSGGVESIKALLDKGVPDICGGLGARVFGMAEVFREINSRYPLISRYVPVYHPDVQGPMDVCEVLWGSSLFLDIYDCPDLVKDFLGLITRTYIAFMREWYSLVPAQEEYPVHWSMIHKGNIMLRNDSAMNLSPGMYAEFIRPYDQAVFDEFGGGGIHFCGHGDHYIETMSEMDGLFAVQLSQPHLNDMEIIYRHTADKGIALIGLSTQAVSRAQTEGRELHGRVQSFG